MKTGHALIIAISVLIGGCAGMAEQLKGVQAVHAELVRTLPEENVGVNLLNNRFLTISLINSPLKKLSAEQKGPKIFEIAKVAYGALPEREQLERINVVFVEQKTYCMFFHSSDGSDSYSVDPREFRGAAEKSQPPSVPIEQPVVSGTPSPNSGAK